MTLEEKYKYLWDEGWFTKGLIDDGITFLRLIDLPQKLKTLFSESNWYIGFNENLYSALTPLTNESILFINLMYKYAKNDSKGKI